MRFTQFVKKNLNMRRIARTAGRNLMLDTQEQISNVAAYLGRITPIDHSDIIEFVAHSRLMTYKKNEVFLREGETCNKLLFCHKGAFRYFLTKEGNDFTKDFCLDTTNPFCTNYTSFLTQTPSLINISSLENSVVSVWSEGYIRELFETLPWLVFARKIAELLFIRKEKREISLLLDSAEERYQKFTKEFKDVMQRVPQYHIASYLGITPESLSRIRRGFVARS